MKGTVRSIPSTGRSIGSTSLETGPERGPLKLTPRQRDQASKLVDRIAQDIAREGWISFPAKP